MTAIDIRDVPDNVRTAVEADAQARDVSLNDVIEQILSDRYGVEWTVSGYPFSGATGTDHWLLRITAELRAELDAHKRRIPGATLRGIVLLNLAAHYGLEPISPLKRIKRLDPAVVAEAKRRHADGRGESLRALSRAFGVKRETLAKAIRA